MTEKRYLKWYNKVGYGSGDIAGNVLNAHASSVLTHPAKNIGQAPLLWR